MTARFSSLPMLQFCAASAVLSQRHGAGRAAAVSTAFHAVCAGAENAMTLMHALSPEEQADVRSWHSPLPCEVGGEKLVYADAVKESEVAIAEDGTPCTFGDPSALAQGHPDLYWVRGKRIFIGDLKRSRFTTSDGPRSLQLVMAGFALAAMYNADSFTCGIWSLTDGEWSWGKEVDMYSDEAAELWKVARAAASRTGTEYGHGPHCRDCWHRLQCPEWVLPAMKSENALAVLDGREMTTDAAYRALQMVEKMELLAGHAREHLKAYARINGGIPDGEGKLWAPNKQAGRESGPSVKALREAFGEAAEPLIKRSPEIEVFRWTKLNKR